MPRPALAALAFLALSLATPAAAGAGPARQGAWSVRLVDEDGRTLPTYRHGGRTYVLGTLGRRYEVVVANASPRRVEVVVSVDGRDVIDGRPASTGKRGYLVEPYGEVRLDGFRVSDATVAAFRFSSVPRSYAARTGDARDVGVVGVAVFAESDPEPEPLPRPLPSPRADAEADAGASAGAAREAPPGAPSAAPERQAARRRGLGTEFGEERGSAVTHVPFERASSAPAAVLSLRYDDRAGLVALGIDVDRRRDDAWLRATAEPFREYAEPPPGWRR